LPSFSPTYALVPHDSLGGLPKILRDQRISLLLLDE
jgi:hypothetical protein